MNVPVKEKGYTIVIRDFCAYPALVRLKSVEYSIGCVPNVEYYTLDGEVLSLLRQEDIRDTMKEAIIMADKWNIENKDKREFWVNVGLPSIEAAELSGGYINV